MDRKWWCEKPQEVLDLWFDNVPITSMENPTANIILINHSKKFKKSKSNMIFLAHNQWDRKLETMHRIIPIIHTQTRLLLTHTFWKRLHAMRVWVLNQSLGWSSNTQMKFFAKIQREGGIYTKRKRGKPLRVACWGRPSGSLLGCRCTCSHQASLKECGQRPEGLLQLTLAWRHPHWALYTQISTASNA